MRLENSRNKDSANSARGPSLSSSKRTTPRIVAFDGAVGSGKSTFGREVTRARGGVFIPEYLDMLAFSEHEGFRELSPTDRIHTLLKIEQERRRSVDTTKWTVLDRSVMSIAAHEYAMVSIDPSAVVSDLPRIFDEATVICPEVHIVLVASDQTRRARCAARRSSMPDVFLSQTYNDRLYEFFLRVSSSLPIAFLTTDEPVAASFSDLLAITIDGAALAAEGQLLRAIGSAWLS